MGEAVREQRRKGGCEGEGRGGIKWRELKGNVVRRRWGKVERVCVCGRSTLGAVMFSTSCDHVCCLVRSYLPPHVIACADLLNVFADGACERLL